MSNERNVVKIGVDVDAKEAAAQIRDLAKAKQELTEPKKGTKTTEFWVTVIVNILAMILTAVGAYKNSEAMMGIGGLLMAVASGTYNKSRGDAKKAPGSK